MDESKIKFGDKFFLYGQLLSVVDDFEEREYNTVQGYKMAGYNMLAVESTDQDAKIPGFVVEILSTPSLATETPFLQMEMIDVTQRLSRTLPLPSGTKVWMPTTL